MARPLHVEVAGALPERQLVISLVLPAGSTVADALAEARLETRLPGLLVNPKQLGVFGKSCKPDRVLQDGDRVEIYRPLKADPKEVRRQLAELERSRAREQD